MLEKNRLIKKIDALLPQTQCGQCSYAGCLPYATAIAENHESLNRCPPGGVKTLKALGELLNQDVSELIPEMQKTEQPPRVAVIREQECIGCTKCIQACPVDAIIGSAKQLHIVLMDECTGCGLCVEPCPVDCIDLKTLAQPTYQPDHARERYLAHQARLSQNQTEKVASAHQKKIDERKSYVEAAVARARAKRLT